MCVCVFSAVSRCPCVCYCVCTEIRRRQSDEQSKHCRPNPSFPLLPPPLPSSPLLPPSDSSSSSPALSPPTPSLPLLRAADQAHKLKPTCCEENEVAWLTKLVNFLRDMSPSPQTESSMKDGRSGGSHDLFRISLSSLKKVGWEVWHCDLWVWAWAWAWVWVWMWVWLLLWV